MTDNRVVKVAAMRHVISCHDDILYGEESVNMMTISYKYLIL